MDRRWVIGIAVLLGIVLLGGIVASMQTPVPEVAAPVPKPSKPAPPLPTNQRIPLPAPRDLSPPELPRERPPPAELTAEDRRLMNVAVDDVLSAARADCLVPWVERIGEPDPVEIVFDAVLHDGRLVDVGMRSMGVALPPEVLDCVADRAWYADWPEWDLPGELRMQRSIDVSAGR